MSASDNDDEGAVLPVAKQALAQKRDVGDLNTRLQMYVTTMKDKTKEIMRSKQALAKQELEHSKKIQHLKDTFEAEMANQRVKQEQLKCDNDYLRRERDDAVRSRKDQESRLISAESRNAALSSETENMRKDISRHKEELDTLRTEFASLKYKHESSELESAAMAERLSAAHKEKERVLRELNKAELERASAESSYQRVVADKNDALEALRGELATLEAQSSDTSSRLRQEFDGKLAEFVQKREDQYLAEKDEWMRIFKDEFNRKLSSFKEANQDLSHTNVTLSEEIADLRTRLSKRTQQKTELEIKLRAAEEESEKLRCDQDDLRDAHARELKVKNAQLIQERDRYKAKELQFDELAGIKLQLDSEIELYRNILNEAEQAQGYRSPLGATSSTSKGARNSRKRRRVQAMGTPMGPPSTLKKATNNLAVSTPGVARAAKLAEQEKMSLFDSLEESPQTHSHSNNGPYGGHGNNDEVKDQEESMLYATPGNLEGTPLQFSGMDLNKGMLEIQNMGETDIDLSGYTLSNQTGTAQYELPKDMKLSSGDKLRIYVGEQVYREMLDGEDDDASVNGKSASLVGDYTGAYVFWKRDVWSADEADCARLYNARQEEVAMISMSPEMVDKSAKGCFVM